MGNYAINNVALTLQGAEYTPWFVILIYVSQITIKNVESKK